MGLGEHAVVSPAHIKKSLHGVIQHPMSRVYFAYLDEMCAGMAVCFEGYSTFLASPIINIHDLVVVPKLRNLGVGRAIVQYIEKEARATLVGKLTLEVRCDNPSAQDLYKGEGFRECSPAMYFWVKYLKEH
jgi:ribosomal protein S18 acetylase RimI-like enzyme